MRLFIKTVGLFLCVLYSPYVFSATQDTITRGTLTAFPKELPIKILNSADTLLYKQIFFLQEQALFSKSNIKIRKLDNRVLMGYVLAQRYLHPKSGKTSYRQLSDWLNAYGDHPQAQKIYTLALTRRPASASPPKAPYTPDVPSSVAAKKETTKKASTYFLRNQWRRQCRKNQAVSLIRKKQFAELLPLLRDQKWQQKKSQTGFFNCRMLIVRSLFLNEQDNLALYAASLRGKTVYPAELHWWSGLSAFRQERYRLAVTAFTKSALLGKPGAHDRLSSSASYWAARSWLRLGNPDQALKMWEGSYKRAPFSFYGQLAAESIGYSVPYNWQDPSFGKLSLLNKNFRFPAAKRALALAQIHKYDATKIEMRRFIKKLSRNSSASYMVLAREMGMTDIAYAIAYSLERDHGVRFHASLYPMPLWRPKDGFKLDPKLIFAFVRQESGFNPQARSSADARGLMQLMPATARFIHQGKLPKNRLYDPSLNLSLGQRYLIHLMNIENADGHMLKMVASYNAGPGNVSRWMGRSDFSHNDPLLYIESLPWTETRHFVKKVMSNFWVYHDKIDIAPLTRRTLAEGKWPNYTRTLSQSRYAY